MAPGEGLIPISILTDTHCEKLAHPYLFQMCKFGYKFQRKVELSPVKYLNQRFLSYKQKLLSDSDYIFFAHSVMRKLKLSSRINISMKKVKTNQLNSAMLRKNSRSRLNHLLQIMGHLVL